MIISVVGLHLVLFFAFFWRGGGSWTSAVTAFFDCYCGIYDSTLLLWNVDYTALAKNRFFIFKERFRCSSWHQFLSK